MSAHALIASRRFGPFLAALTLSAFNDNFYKNSLVILMTYQLAAQMGLDAAKLIAVASAFFILPFFLFSGVAGELADALPKHRLVRFLKLFECVLMLLAAAALLTHQSWLLLGILFLVGAQAAFFGPTKYAILPQLLQAEELLLANGIVEGSTFVSILLGTLIGGLVILQPGGLWIVAGTMVGLGLVGTWAAYRVPPTPAISTDSKVHWNVFSSTWRMVRHACDNPAILAPIMGISWFWAIGMTYLTQLPVFTKDVLGANETVVTLFNGVFTVGVALGSFLCPLIVEKFKPRFLSAWALGGVSLFGLDVCWVGSQVMAPRPEEMLGLMAYLNASFDHWRIAIDLFFMAFCGGLFIVPLYTQLQTRAQAAERARTIASNNVMNALFIAAASLLAGVLFQVGLGVVQVLLFASLLNVVIIWVLIVHARRGAQIRKSEAVPPPSPE